MLPSKSDLCGKRSDLRSGLKDHLAVIPKEVRRGLGQSLGKTDRHPVIRNKVGFQSGLGKVGSQSFAQHNLEVFVNSHQSVIKSSIVQIGKAQTVARIESVVGEFSPRLDVTRYQQTRNIDAADTAANSVGA